MIFCLSRLLLAASTASFSASCSTDIFANVPRLLLGVSLPHMQVANIGTNLRPRSATRDLRATRRAPGQGGSQFDDRLRIAQTHQQLGTTGEHVRVFPAIAEFRDTGAYLCLNWRAREYQLSHVYVCKYFSRLGKRDEKTCM